MTSLLNYRILEVNPASHEFCNNAGQMRPALRAFVDFFRSAPGAPEGRAEP